MNIHNHEPEEVEAFVRSQRYFLDDRVKSSLNPDLCIEDISINPNQGGRKTIYNLGLSDGSTVVLKICHNLSIRREIEGLRYASTQDILAPKIHGYEINEDNPLKKPFILMEHVPQQFKDAWRGDYEVNIWGGDKVLSVDYEFVRDRLDNLLEVIPRLNKKCERQSPIDIFKEYTVYLESNNDFYLKFQELQRFYEKNCQLFQGGLEYHLHGDLDFSNMISTQNGIVFIDWGNYSKGDIAEDLAYFAIRNIWFDYDEYAGKLVELISKKDKNFAKRFGFHVSMSKLWHVIYHSFPKEYFLESPLFC
ncbi:MAG: phosphotransferase [Candidatus Hodarchaeota archaeon]